jgi:hypothetical protein
MKAINAYAAYDAETPLKPLTFARKTQVQRHAQLLVTVGYPVKHQIELKQ